MLSFALGFIFIFCIILVMWVWIFPYQGLFLFCLTLPLVPLSQEALIRIPILKDGFIWFSGYPASSFVDAPGKAIIQLLAMLGITLWSILALMNNRKALFVFLRPPFSYFFLYAVLIGVCNLAGFYQQRSFFLWFIGVWGTFLCTYMFFQTYRIKGSKFFLTFLDYSFIFYILVCIFAWRYNNIKSTDMDSYLLRRGGFAIYASNFSFPLILLWLPFVLQRIFHQEKRGRLRLYVFLALSGALLFLGMSRGAMLSMIMICFLSFFFLRSRVARGKVKLLSVGAISFIFLLRTSFFKQLLLGYWARFFGSTHKSGVDNMLLYMQKTEGRLTIIQEAWGLWKENPLFGIGLGSFRMMNEKHYSSAHNLFMNVLVEHGLIGSLGFVLLFLLTSLRIWKKKMPYRTAYFLGLLGFFSISMTTGSKLVQPSWLFTGLPMYFLFFINLIPEITYHEQNQQQWVYRKVQ